MNKKNVIEKYILDQRFYKQENQFGFLKKLKKKNLYFSMKLMYKISYESQKNNLYLKLIG